MYSQNFKPHYNKPHLERTDGDQREELILLCGLLSTQTVWARKNQAHVILGTRVLHILSFVLSKIMSFTFFSQVIHCFGFPL